MGRIVKAKQTPTRDVSNELIQVIVDALGEKVLNEFFTRLELQMIPDMVRRWKKLRALNFVGLPERRVSDYLRQATTCYLNGLPTATAILCRTVLQFALEEAIPTLGGIRLEVNRHDRHNWLVNLIK